MRQKNFEWNAAATARWAFKWEMEVRDTVHSLCPLLDPVQWMLRVPITQVAHIKENAKTFSVG